MDAQKRMPRYDIRNDGIGPFAVFYCDKCGREYRSRPNVGNTIAKDIGRDAMGGFFRGIPLIGHAVADNVVGEDPRYTYRLTDEQLAEAWQQVEENFRHCPTCLLTVCLSDFDVQSGFCQDDSPRREQIAEAQAEQAAGVVKGLASAFGFGEAIKAAGQAAKAVSSQLARCPNDGTTAAAGTKFCPQCGSPMIQPAKSTCPSCGKEMAAGIRFCPECGAKIEQPAPAPTVCPNCGVDAKGAKFCSECGTKIG
jgi:hypothetical protein